MFAALDLASSNGEAVDLDDETLAGAQPVKVVVVVVVVVVHTLDCCGVRLCQLVDD